MRRPILPPTLLQGPPLPLPVLLDLAAERWAGLAPRRRRALATVLVVAGGALALRPASHPWGPTTDVVRVVHDVPAGQPLAPGDLTLAPWPVALLPRTPVTDLDGLVGTAPGTDLVAGTVLDARRLRSASPADRAPVGWVAVPLASEQLPDLQVGMVVDLHGGDGQWVRGALVLEAGADRVWLGMLPVQASTLASALAWGEVRIAIHAPPAG